MKVEMAGSMRGCNGSRVVLVWSVHGETGPQQVLLVTHVGGRAGPGPVPRSGYTTLCGRFMSS